MRDMVPADVDAVFAIEQAVQAYPWTRGNFADALNNGYFCRVDEAGGEIRSYAVLMPVVDEAELLNIGVAADQQRRGVGRAMLLEMLDLACGRNMIRVFLEVRASNTAALALYHSAGFVEIGLRKGYYRNAGGGDDAIAMVCSTKNFCPGTRLTGEIDG